MCANRGGAIVGFIISRMARQLCDEFAQGRGARIKTRPIAELAAEEGLLPLCVLPRLGDAAFDSGGKAGIHVGQVGELAAEEPRPGPLPRAELQNQPRPRPLHADLCWVHVGEEAGLTSESAI